MLEQFTSGNSPFDASHFTLAGQGFTIDSLDKLTPELLQSHLSRKVQLNVRWNDCIIKKQCQPL